VLDLFRLVKQYSPFRRTIIFLHGTRPGLGGIDPRFRPPFTSEMPPPRRRSRRSERRRGTFRFASHCFEPIVAKEPALFLSLLLRPRRPTPYHHNHSPALIPGQVLLKPLLRLNPSTPASTSLKLQPRHNPFPASTLGQERLPLRSLVQAILKTLSRRSRFRASAWTLGLGFRIRTPWSSLSARREPEMAVTSWKTSVYSTATCKGLTDAQGKRQLRGRVQL
jgi:hypothetical protein